MASTIHINRIDGQQENMPLPFEELVVLLKKEGFVIKPDDYIELLKVVQDFPDDDLQQLKYRLAPLIVSSEQEQSRFYAVFDKYARDNISLDESFKKAVRKKNRKKIILYSAMTFLILAGISFYLYKKEKSGYPVPDFRILVNNNISNVALQTDTIVADASLLFYEQNYDTAAMRISWDTGKGWQDQGKKYLPLNAPAKGPLNVKMRLQYGEMDSVVTHSINICSGIIVDLESSDSKNAKQFFKGSDIIIRPVVRGDNSVTDGAVWVINQRDTIRNQAGELNYNIDSAGNYSIDYLPAENKNFCSQFAPVEFYAGEYSGDNIELASIGQPVVPRLKLRPWLYLLFMIPLFGYIVTWWLEVRAKNKQQKEEHEQPADNTRELKPPMDIPLLNNELELVAREPELNVLFRGMRKKIEDESQVLNINKSIRSEILAGGVPSLVFSQRMKQQEFLFLIDRTKNQGQQLKLFDYLLNLLAEENINVEKFYYSSFDNFYNREFPEGISLQRLSELYKSYILVLFGNGYQLLYPHLPAIDKETKYRLGDWEMKALVTPLPYNDWGAKEEALKKEFIIVPADIQGQVLLIQAFTEKQFDHEKNLQTLSSLYDTGSWRLDNARQIKEYIGNELLYQWLCGIAVYPKLRWEIIIEIGKAILQKAGKEDMLNFSNLLKLVRIPWMQEGTIPESTRLELLKNLSVENEVVARETILRLLQQPDAFADDAYFFRQEKKMQQLTNEFVLFAHDQEKYKQFEPAFAAFKARWNQGRIFDAPMVRYLGGQQGEGWPTLTNTGREGIQQMLNEKRNNLKDKKNSSFRNAYIILGLVVLFLAAIFLLQKNYLKNVKISGISLLQADSSQTHLLAFNFLADSCRSDSVIKGNVILNGKNYDLKFSSWNKATINAPYRDIAANEAVINLTWNNDQDAGDKQIIVSSTNDIRLRSCSGPDLGMKQQMQIIYNDPLKEDSVKLLANLLQDRFNVRLQLQTDATTSGIFFTPGGVQYADNVQQWVKSIFRIDAVVGAASDTAVNSIYLNFPKIEQWTNVGLASLPASLNEIWKGITNNRLITINVPARSLWYSTGNPQTYGTYRIEDAWRKGNTTKLIVSDGKQFRVFFLQNIRQGSFRVCLLPDFLASKTLAEQADVTMCQNLEAMAEYYPSNNASYLFPVRQDLLLNTAQTSRLLKASASNGYNSVPVVTYYHNSFFTIGANTASKRIAGIYEALKTQDQGTESINTVSGTPFDRDYIDITWTRDNNANQYPNQANQTAVPNQAQKPADDYSAQNKVPNEPVEKPANDQQQAATGNWEFITTINFSTKNEPMLVNESEFKEISNTLNSVSNARIKIVGYYGPTADMKQAENFVFRAKEYLAKNFQIVNNPATNNVITTVEKSNVRSKTVTKANGNRQVSRNYVGIYGINIKKTASKY